MSYWKPTKGHPHVIKGHVREVGFSDYGAKAMHVEALDGEWWSIPVEQVTLTRGLARERPPIDSGVVIRYNGTRQSKAGRSYNDYTVVSEHHLDTDGFDGWFEAVHVERDEDAPF